MPCDMTSLLLLSTEGGSSGGTRDPLLAMQMRQGERGQGEWRGEGEATGRTGRKGGQGRGRGGGRISALGKGASSGEWHAAGGGRGEGAGTGATPVDRNALSGCVCVCIEEDPPGAGRSLVGTAVPLVAEYVRTYSRPDVPSGGFVRAP